MFICNTCLRENFENEPSWAASSGPCELCHEVRSCSDIPSRVLRNKTAAEKARSRVQSEFHAKAKTPLERMDDLLKDDD